MNKEEIEMLAKCLKEMSETINLLCDKILTLQIEIELLKKGLK